MPYSNLKYAAHTFASKLYPNKQASYRWLSLCSVWLFLVFLCFIYVCAGIFAQQNKLVSKQLARQSIGIAQTPKIKLPQIPQDLSVARSPFFDSLGLQVSLAYGHNHIQDLKPWRGLIIGGGFITDLNIFRWTQIKLGLGLNLQGEFYFLPAEQKPFYLAERGYLRLLSLRFANRMSFFPKDFLYFGLGTTFSVNLTGVLGDGQRGEIKTYQSFLVPYVTLHVGYKHPQPLLKQIRWSIELHGKITVNNETHLELGSRVIFAYQFSKR